LAKLPEDLRIAVNVSPIQFANPALPATVMSAIADAQIDPARLELEITESVFLGDEDATEKMFKALKDIGVRLALDDFGTGYSSLAYLKNAPFDKIKIDQSFVRGAIAMGSRNAAIIEAIVRLSKTLGMETTAEGVEHQDEIELIRKLGCSHIQGFVYGKGRELADLVPKLKNGSRKVLPVGHKRTRDARIKLLRASRMKVNEQIRDIRIRNISSTGAMIDNVDFPERAIGVNILIELLENETALARIRWTGRGQAGVEFSNPINPENLKAIAPESRDGQLD
jgi:EAL domain-containing protein (putative c-di-GMP-specific phosphodiesterase class I)